MVLHDASIYGSAERKHIHIQNGLIKTISGSRESLKGLNDECRLELDGATVLPGFINSHDHLDFNSYPQLGNRIYTNYTEWGKDIHTANADVIKAVQQIPQSLRIKWGLYKNLLNGFTTVVNHGEKLAVDDTLVTVFQECYPLHSPAFEPNWSLKLNHPLRTKRPFVMHIGEGTDEAAHTEIDKVIKVNLFKRKIVAVHGVAMDTKQASSFEALVWCPASNFFLLDKTAAVEQLKEKTNIVFGTDSTLTSSWHIAEHFKPALASDMVTEKELLDMLTTTPARLWGLADRGKIEEGMKADLLVTSDGSSIFNQEPFDMVLHNGEVGLVSAGYFQQMKKKNESTFDRIVINTKPVYVKKGITGLVKEIQFYYSDAAIPFTIAS